MYYIVHHLARRHLGSSFPTQDWFLFYQHSPPFHRHGLDPVNRPKASRHLPYLVIYLGANPPFYTINVYRPFPQRPRLLRRNPQLYGNSTDLFFDAFQEAVGPTTYRGDRTTLCQVYLQVKYDLLDQWSPATMTFRGRSWLDSAVANLSPTYLFASGGNQVQILSRFSGLRRIVSNELEKMAIFRTLISGKELDDAGRFNATASNKGATL
ncbi:hypothetical protein P152DRAFT_158481 [Eremomyces bilateralis CBS 781.70]|uniref:Uncharacterized protein n=1 Tax=Eremomyces bilateralis CBS 781.70 TaxID=1392243 RepID=A0A6G1FUU5_9PEZI|nr:uncharacterized protein P152DRAFT_158481 [Eremomyces bilateralis CBS 781.70]KAF1809478.1 hypothetical protein P152DRAFT_158481 [Eremomyces bilateralis CBS 781.70]